MGQTTSGRGLWHVRTHNRIVLLASPPPNFETALEIPKKKNKKVPLLWIISLQPHAFPAQLLTLFMSLPFLPVAFMTFFFFHLFQWTSGL